MPSKEHLGWQSRASSTQPVSCGATFWEEVVLSAEDMLVSWMQRWLACTLKEGWGPDVWRRGRGWHLLPGCGLWSHSVGTPGIMSEAQNLRHNTGLQNWDHSLAGAQGTRWFVWGRMRSATLNWTTGSCILQSGERDIQVTGSGNALSSRCYETPGKVVFSLWMLVSLSVTLANESYSAHVPVGFERQWDNTGESTSRFKCPFLNMSFLCFLQST